MLLSLQRNNINKGSGAECPHPFGQGYTVWVRCGRARSVRAGYGPVGSGGRGEMRLDLLRFVAVCLGGHGGLVRVGRGSSGKVRRSGSGKTWLVVESYGAARRSGSL